MEGQTVKRRGRPRRIDRDRIISVAKTLDPDTLTMQALATEMGVDRKTLHYHVENRDSLLKLVAADAFRDAITQHDFVEAKEWRPALRAFAAITRDAVARAGAWASYVDFTSESDLEALRPSEAALRALIDAGLSSATAGRVVAMTAVLAFASSRDSGAAIDGAGTHPQESNLKHALDEVPEAGYPILQYLLGSGAASLGSDEQFEFEMTLIELGVERMLTQS